ncbi:MAG: chemotaxis-specific protein-glutamate methyltransferase CheB, partial [Bdellovibrionaceae bacterium]|nr:chemotaxis-specific protein-glutamate methyltransferase CheB [Pseudobdellovibrionaceae bacterium]
PLKAEEMVITSRPDVITLDIHMPGLNGVDLLKQLFPKYKIPAVMITSVSLEEGPIVLEALSNGAVDYIRKPTLQELPHLAPELREKVKIAARANKDSAPRRISRGNFRSDAASAPAHSGGSLSSNVLVAIGSSTGGTQALESLLVQLPFGIPPILIVQHIPALFSSALARRLNEICPFEVKEAADGDQILPNRVLLAPGGKQMRVRKRRKETDPFTVEITDDSPVNRHKPSVDYLYDSIAEQKIPTIGVILTGMGNDGAKGLLNLRQTGARTIAQDEASCVVFGMPKEAIRLGAAQEVLSLEKIPAKLMSWLQHDHKVA